MPTGSRARAHGGPVRTVHHVGTGARAHGVLIPRARVLPAVAQTSRGGEGRDEEVSPRLELPQIYTLAHERLALHHGFKK